MKLISKLLVFLCFPITAHAYIGPGAGLSAIGSAIALAAVIILFAVGFMWYPIKRILRGRNSDDDNPESSADKKHESDESSGLS